MKVQHGLFWTISYADQDRRNEQTDRVCAVYASFIPRATNTTGRAPYPGTGSVKAGNACSSNKNWRLQNGKSTTRIPNHDPLKVANKATGHTTQPESPMQVNDKNREPRTTFHRKHNDRTRNPTPDANRQCRPMTKTRNHEPLIADISRPQTDKK